jgi:chromate transport protein ChrA
MIGIHIPANLWLLYLYRHAYFEYLSYNSIFFNLMYFVVGYLSLRRPGRFSGSLVGLCALVQPMAWMVTVLYWAYIYGYAVDWDAPMSHNVTSIVGHILNTVFPVWDLYWSDLQLRWTHISIPLAVLTIYRGFLWFLLYLRGECIYLFMNEYLHQKNWEVRYLYFEIQFNALVVFFFILTKGFIYHRDRWLRPRLGYSRLEEKESMDEWREDTGRRRTTSIEDLPECFV